ncbi:sigma-70 family RNA polymerase sigma factor [Saccharothrix variisporea]|uniref:RNA polymerase sigma-70 factor (ECF subfamily) n=1 Tax=Saccharothrix variisporea TaxID=543527 RepID=A0A495X982_9PSEU|nr:sigma-70 family RNA polymerase sigma factor [Saccharothrix variisporea]RKT69926.1 RNA polymerase sigma-70 factor (ECF subfamily) [Saccharothrix variisporea]
MDVFEEHRPRLTAVAYRMLGSLADADDAVQETWLRYSRTSEVENVAAWLTTVVSRVCLNMLRTRERRRESLGVTVPDPVISGPDEDVAQADAVGLALMVVLDTLSPAERVAFVLHDMFAVPFEEIAALVERSTASVRQLASRARRRVRAAAPVPDASVARQREVVDAFFAATREGSLEALVAVLDPSVVLRSDGGVGSRHTVVLSGASTVARQAAMFGGLAGFARPALVNGAAGVVVIGAQGVLSIMGFGVVEGRIVSIDVIADPARLAGFDLSAVGS